MLTNNYRVFLKNQFFPALSSNVIKTIEGNSYTSIDPTNNTKSIASQPRYYSNQQGPAQFLANIFNPYRIYINSMSYTSESSSCVGVFLGSNSSSPDPTDFTIKTIPNLQTNFIYETTGELNKPCLDMTIEVTNKNSSTISINEIGLVQSVVFYNFSSSGSLNINTGKFLMERTLLDIPLILTPLESGVLRYYIDIDITPNVN